MRKFLIGLLVGVVLTFMGGVIIAFSVARLGDRRPTISADSTLVMRLEGEVPERTPVDNPLPFIGSGSAPTVLDVWSTLRTAATDTRIKAILLMPQNVGVGWAKLQEIRQDILEFKKSGKPVVAYLHGAGTREYYLATAADKIYVSPEDLIDVKGLRAQSTFFKGTLDKLGVQAEIYHVGRYKDAGDMVTETAMTPATREVMNSVLDVLYSNLIETIASGRKKTPEEIRATLDEGPFTARLAKTKGLIDDLRYEDQVYGELKTQLKQSELKRVSFKDYVKAVSPASTKRGKNRIALIVGDGTIARTSSDSSANPSDDVFASGPFIKMLRSVGNDKDIQGVILRVDSPGGDAIASDEMLREVKLLSQKKPLVVSMSDLAASGGYYVAMTGDPIIAYPGTLTGSIGIIYGKLNLRGLYDKLGVTKDILMRGKNADIDSDYHPLTEDGKAKLRETLDEFYNGFVTKAAQARKRGFKDVEPLAQGRVWMGSQAKSNGLVDELGGLDKAIEVVKKKANIKPEESVSIVPFPGKRSVFDEWFRTSSETSMEAQADWALDRKIRTLLNGLDYKAWSKGGMMAVMPYQLSFK